MNRLLPQSGQLAAVLALLMLPQVSFGHSPHHVITEVAATPSQESPGHVFILITDQIFRSDETGFAWKILENGLNNQFPFTSISISPDFELDATVFISSAGDGVYRSTNGGDSWDRINSGLGKLDIEQLFVSKNETEGLIALAAAKTGGVWRYDQSSNRWRMVLTENVQISDFADTAKAGDRSIFVAGDKNGRLWRSVDNGLLWEILYEIPDAQSINSVAGVDDHLFVGTEGSGLFSSTDGGRSFHLNDQLTSLRIEDCRGNQLELAVPDRYISSVSVLSGPGNKPNLFVTTWFNGVYVSDDWGDSWATWNQGLSCDQQADDMHERHFRNVTVTSNRGSQPVYWVGAFDGLFRGVGGDPRWQQRETLPVGLIKGMAVAEGRRDGTAIGLSTYGGGFYVTEDAGSTWTVGNNGLRTTRLTGISFSASFSEDGVIYAGASRRLLKSSDYGASWQQIDLSKPSFGTRVRNKLKNWGLPVSFFGSSYDAGSPIVYPTNIVQLPGDESGQILFGTRSHGIMQYDVNDLAIDTLYSHSENVVSGLSTSTDFAKDRTLFASIRGAGLLRSKDGGRSWAPINKGLSFFERWLDDPKGDDFRRDVQLAVSPDVAADRSLYAGSPAGDGLFVSEDLGDSWLRLSSIDRQPIAVLAIALSPEFGSDDTMLVSVKGEGLFRSTDRGKTFGPVGRQLIANNTSIEYLAFSPSTSVPRKIVAASDEDLFISTNFGESWNLITRPVRYEDIQEVVRIVGPHAVRRGSDLSASTETLLASGESRATLHFIGTGVRWLGSTGPDSGIAQVSIDGSRNELVDTSSSNAAAMQEIFRLDGLEFGAHTIEIQPIVDPKDSVVPKVSVDAFDVLPTASTAN